MASTSTKQRIVENDNPLNLIKDENLNTFTNDELIEWYYIHCKNLTCPGDRREEIFFEYLRLPIQEKRNLLGMLISLNGI